MALRQHSPVIARTVRYAPAARRASLSERGFVFGVYAMLLLVVAGAGTVWLHFKTHDLKLQQAQLQTHALELEQDRLRLEHAVERLADPVRLKAIARTDLGLVDLGAPELSSTVLVEESIPQVERNAYLRRNDPTLVDQEPPRLVTAAVNLLGATEAVAAPVLGPKRSQRQ